MMRFAFSVEVVPVPKARAGRNHGRAYVDKRTLEYQRAVRLAATVHTPKGWSKEGAMMVVIRSYTKTARRVDVDNLAKSVLDAMNGVAYGDDSQVVDLQATKAVDRARPRVEVEVRRV